MLTAHGRTAAQASFHEDNNLLFAERGRGTSMAQARRGNTAVMGGILIGIGMGGFVDGIVLHQILQWHNMLSNWIPPTSMEAMRINMRWDGVFHAFVWLVTLAGILRLWNAARQGEPIPSGRA